jgi:hypothetical protein
VTISQKPGCLRFPQGAIDAHGESGDESGDPKGGKKGGPKGSPKGGPKGGGKNGEGCRFVRDNKPCPYRDQCFSVWSNPPPVDLAACVKASAASSGGSASSGGEPFPEKGVTPVSDVV